MLARASIILLLILAPLALPAAPASNGLTLEDLVGTEFRLYTVRHLSSSEMMELARRVAEAYHLEEPALKRVSGTMYEAFHIYSASAEGNTETSATILVGSLGEVLVVQKKRLPEQECLTPDTIASILGGGEWSAREDGNTTLTITIAQYVKTVDFRGETLERIVDRTYKASARIVEPLLGGTPFRPVWAQACREVLVVEGAIPKLADARTYTLTAEEAERVATALGARSPGDVIVSGIWLALDRQLHAIDLVLQLKTGNQTLYAVADPYTLRLRITNSPPIPPGPGEDWIDWYKITSRSIKPESPSEPLLGKTGAISLTLVVILLVGGILYGWYKWHYLPSYE